MLGDASQRKFVVGSLGESIFVDGHDFSVIQADQFIVHSQRLAGPLDLRDRAPAAVGEMNADPRDDRSPLSRVLARLDADPVSTVKSVAHVCSFGIRSPLSGSRNPR